MTLLARARWISLLPSGALLLAIAAEAQSPVREVFTRTELEAAGVHRLSELIQWVSGWSATVEGVAWGAGLDALPPGSLARVALPDVALLVNGQRVAVDAHGAWLPEVAPVLVQQVDSVVVTRAPGLAGGSIAPRGTVHVHLRTVPAGVSASAWYRNGAETGDPGPYLWTSRATPNIDRTGPDAVGVFGYGGRHWNAEVSARYIRQDVTDPRLREHHGDGHSRFVYTRGPALRVGVDALRGRHELLLSRVNQLGSAYFADAGRLVHGSLTATHVGAIGVIGRELGSGITYRLTRSVLSSEHGAGPGIANGRTASHGSLEWRIPAADWEAIATVAADSWRLEAVESRGEPRRNAQVGLALGVERNSADGTGERVAVSLMRVGARLAARATASSERGIGGGRRLYLAGSSVQVLPEEAYRADAWIVPDGPTRTLPDIRLLWSEVGVRQSVGSGIVSDIGVVLGSIQTGRIAGSTAGRQTPQQPRYRGTRLGARIGISFGDSLVRGRIVYRSIAPVTASEDLERASALVPAHTVHGSLAYSLAPSFRLAATAAVRSSVRWAPAFSPVSGDSLSPVTRLDLSAEKWLWRRRIRAQLMIRNALDTPEQYHPAGADFGMRYFLVASLATR